ncbi:3229_t:CDS:2 [Cetraspora pellucida]|uniref:3229_t:CDS:1 n=1 Tax=Cetraspora pellucida TaxID=1433469 RepID=A0A9N9IAW8_9GLOM|nr:3229_t:CDS:2 [Cetraspora pellucida]
MPIWNDYDKGEEDGHGHFGAIFEPIKQVINLLESRTATLADCFIGIVQIAIAFKKIPISNDLHALIIADIEFSSNLMPATWWGVVKDEYNHLQELAKTMFAIIPS